VAEKGEIDHIIRIENKKSHAIIHVQLKDGTKAVCYVGGKGRVYFDVAHHKIKFHVSWKP